MIVTYTMEELSRMADEWEAANPRPEPDWDRAFALAAAQLDPGEVLWIHREECPFDSPECLCLPFRIEKATA